MTVTMRKGAYYERRDGPVVGPMRKSGELDYPWVCPFKNTYADNGLYTLPFRGHLYDFVREVPNPNMKERKMLLTETVTTTKIKEVIDGKGPGGTTVSVVLITPKECQIVIGSLHVDSCGSFFDRGALTELIAELTAVRDALEE